MGHTPETRARAYEKMKQARKTWLEGNGPCQACGAWENLEVDHVEPSEKEDHSVWSWAPERRAEELSKCQVLCKVCHAEKTRKERQSVPIQHGKYATYVRRGCRCETCRAGYNAFRRVFRQKDYKGRLAEW